MTAIVATREAPSDIAARVENLRAADFPQDRLQIVIAIDASGPYRQAEYRALLGTDATVHCW